MEQNGAKVLKQGEGEGKGHELVKNCVSASLREIK
jgi:hypothetical protein